MFPLLAAAYLHSRVLIYLANSPSESMMAVQITRHGEILLGYLCASSHLAPL